MNLANFLVGCALRFSKRSLGKLIEFSIFQAWAAIPLIFTHPVREYGSIYIEKAVAVPS